MDCIRKTARIIVALVVVVGTSSILQAAMPLTEQVTLVQADGGASKLFGSSVAIDGNLIAIGVIGDSAGVYNSGSVIPFSFDGAQWKPEPKIIASKLVAYGNFGNSVALRNGFLAVGAPGDDQQGGDSGAVYMYSRNADGWISDVKLLAGDTASGDTFGSVLAMDTDVLLVGAYADDDAGGASGSAYVFNRVDTTWKETQKLVASDGASEDFFGKALSIYGTSGVVGAPGDDGVVSDSGCAYIFTHRGNEWMQTKKLSSDKPQMGAAFGVSVAVWGPYIAIGAPGEQVKFSTQGAVYIYVFDGTDWLLKTKLTAFDGQKGDAFGKTLSMRGDYLLVGAPSRDENTTDTGVTYVYQLLSGNWVNTGRYSIQKPVSSDELGQALTTDGRFAVVAAPKRDASESDSGAVFVYDLSLIPTLTPTPTFTKPKPPTTVPSITPSPVPTAKPTLTPTPAPTKMIAPQSTPTSPRPTDTPFSRLDE